MREEEKVEREELRAKLAQARRLQAFREHDHVGLIARSHRDRREDPTLTPTSTFEPVGQNRPD